MDVDADSTQDRDEVTANLCTRHVSHLRVTSQGLSCKAEAKNPLKIMYMYVLFETPCETGMLMCMALRTLIVPRLAPSHEMVGPTSLTRLVMRLMKGSVLQHHRRGESIWNRIPRQQYAAIAGMGVPHVIEGKQMMHKELGCIE